MAFRRATQAGEKGTFSIAGIEGMERAERRDLVLFLLGFVQALAEIQQRVASQPAAAVPPWPLPHIAVPPRIATAAPRAGPGVAAALALATATAASSLATAALMREACRRSSCR